MHNETCALRVEIRVSRLPLIVTKISEFSHGILFAPKSDFAEGVPTMCSECDKDFGNSVRGELGSYWVPIGFLLVSYWAAWLAWLARRRLPPPHLMTLPSLDGTIEAKMFFHVFFIDPVTKHP